jgi:hypothetical protein
MQVDTRHSGPGAPHLPRVVELPGQAVGAGRCRRLPRPRRREPLPDGLRGGGEGLRLHAQLRAEGQRRGRWRSDGACGGDGGLAPGWAGNLQAAAARRGRLVAGGRGGGGGVEADEGAVEKLRRTKSQAEES